MLNWKERGGVRRYLQYIIFLHAFGGNEKPRNIRTNLGRLRLEQRTSVLEGGNFKPDITLLAMLGGSPSHHSMTRPRVRMETNQLRKRYESFGPGRILWINGINDLSEGIWT
jgi:hypothetical protein